MARDLPGHPNERRHHLAAGAPADELMPAIFFLTLPPDGETGIGAEARSKAERDDVLGYSGHLSFHGGFDQFGFVPQREYRNAVETPDTPTIAAEEPGDRGDPDAFELRPGADTHPG